VSQVFWAFMASVNWSWRVTSGAVWCSCCCPCGCRPSLARTRARHHGRAAATGVAVEPSALALPGPGWWRWQVLEEVMVAWCSSASRSWSVGPGAAGHRGPSHSSPPAGARRKGLRASASRATPPASMRRFFMATRREQRVRRETPAIHVGLAGE
jgi:hypothetical protein